jgi:hypothetical protein
MAGNVELNCDEDILRGSYRQFLRTIQVELSEIIVLDIASELTNTSRQVLPQKAESLLRARGLAFSTERIQSICADIVQIIHEDQIRQANAFVKSYIQRGRFVDLVKGHFILGIIRRLVFEAIEAKLGRKPNMDDKALVMLIAGEIWQSSSPDHMSLKRRLLRAIRDAIKLKSKSGSTQVHCKLAIK